jgi:hypothetical protein
LKAAGATLVPIRVDAEGLRVSEGLTHARDARLAVVTPSHQSPLGVALSLPRRLALLSWAGAAGAWIIEDDYDSEFRYVGRPLPALKSLDRRQRVIYASSFSKVLYPSLRLGYLVVPESLAAAFARSHCLRRSRCCLDERIETVTGEIKELSRVEAKCRRLRSVPGIGPLISTAIVAAIGTGEAFDRGRDFAAWLGLVPRQHSTGGRSILGRISKRGSKYLRTLLIQAAKVLLMRPHNWPRFSFGPWLKTASERLHRHKLAVALANKLARIAWSVLRYDEAFDTHLEAVAI